MHILVEYVNSQLNLAIYHKGKIGIKLVYFLKIYECIANKLLYVMYKISGPFLVMDTLSTLSKKYIMNY